MSIMTHTLAFAYTHSCACFRSRRYVARCTMQSLQNMFSGARDIMEWLGECARIIALTGHPVSWITPLGLPVVQVRACACARALIV